MQQPATPATTALPPDPDPDPDVLEHAATAGEAIRGHLLQVASGPNIFDLAGLRAAETAVRAGISIAESLQLLWPASTTADPTDPRPAAAPAASSRG